MKGWEKVCSASLSRSSHLQRTCHIREGWTDEEEEGDEEEEDEFDEDEGKALASKRAPSACTRRAVSSRSS